MRLIPAIRRLTRSVACGLPAHHQPKTSCPDAESSLACGPPSAAPKPTERFWRFKRVALLGAALAVMLASVSHAQVDDLVERERQAAIAKEAEGPLKCGATGTAQSIAGALLEATGEAITGQVPYGSTLLSRIAYRFRQVSNIASGRNVAVFQYLENGVSKTWAMASQRGVGHAERLVAKRLAQMGIEPSAVTAIYSELQPCVLPGGYCELLIEESFAQAAVTYSFEYGATLSSRQAGLEAMKKALGACK